MTTAPAARVSPRAPGQTRADVVSLFNNQYTPALAVPAGWTGSIVGCVPGVTSGAFEAATIQMVNYFRTMVGLPIVTLDTNRTAGPQQAALMMLAQGDLSHTPPTTWACYTAAGAASAGTSNLALGSAGAGAVNLYMNDEGVANLGHRRWVISPVEVSMGTGSTNASNALDVIGNFGARPAAPEYVSWPPAGFVPYQVVYNTWSLAFPDADFTNATVAMAFQGAPVQLTVTQLPNGFGDNAIAWRPQNLGIGAGVTDRVFSVSVGNVVINGAPRTFTYNVTVIDPALAPPVDCGIRPRPTMSVVNAGSGQIRATITATGTNNTVVSLRIGTPARAITNARVDVQGVATNVANGQTVTMPAGSTQAVLTMSRLAAGAATVPFVMVDGCGDWPTFVGLALASPDVKSPLPLVVAMARGLRVMPFRFAADAPRSLDATKSTLLALQRRLRVRL